MAKWGRPRSCLCGKCQKCKHADYMRRYYASKSREERFRLFRQGRDVGADRRRARERYYRMKGDPVFDRRRRASSELNKAINRGDIERGACEVCGQPDAHGHHDDYDKPLEVRWLCPQHHADEHQKAA